MGCARWNCIRDNVKGDYITFGKMETWYEIKSKGTKRQNILINELSACDNSVVAGAHELLKRLLRGLPRRHVVADVTGAL